MEHCEKTAARGGWSIRETSDELGCSDSTTYELLNNGELESYRIGRARRITPESVRAYKQRHAVKPPLKRFKKGEAAP